MTQKKSSILDPLVKVEVYGVPADVAEKKTHHVDNNGSFLLLYCNREALMWYFSAILNDMIDSTVSISVCARTCLYC